MEIFVQFLLRLSFGLAAGMGITSSRQVASGFFRNHLYVTLGLATLAALASYAGAPRAFWYTVGAAAASYVGSVCWLYERPRAGKVMLWGLAAVSLLGSQALVDRSWPAEAGAVSRLAPGEQPVGERPRDGDRTERQAASGLLFYLANASSGLLLGTTIAAMFLGHWYLNAPTMELAPLRRLLLAMAAALAVQVVVSVAGLLGELSLADQWSTHWLLFVALRWSFGLFGVAILTWMAWQTLTIPNTQSATGILYVAVIGVFVGELTAALLSAESTFAL